MIAIKMTKEFFQNTYSCIKLIYKKIKNKQMKFNITITRLFSFMSKLFE